MTARQKKDKRVNPRLNDSIPVKISNDAGNNVTETMNISRSGAYCRVNKYIEPMTKLNLHLLVPVQRNSGASTKSKKITCGGVVVRTEPVDESELFNVAIFFNDISAKDAEAISEYVSHHLELSGDIL